MQVNLSQLNRQPISQFRSSKIRFSASDPSERNFSFKLPGGLSLTGSLNLKDFDLNVVQGRLNSLLSKTHSFINEVRSPLVKTKKPLPEEDFDPNDDDDDDDEALVTEKTIRAETPNGKLSLAAIISIEQFSRMNGLSGKKMQKIFQAVVPPPMHNDARNFVEFCCFRFLSRDNSDIHVHLKDPVFQKLIFITMLAWESPYEENPNTNSQDNASEMASLKEIMKSKIVGKEAFIRIAPAVSGVADRSTVHNLFKALTRDGRGISFSTWSSYIQEILQVQEHLKSFKIPENPPFHSERVLCTSSHRLELVLLWDDKMAWPGTLTLTDRALYFESVNLFGKKSCRRLDIAGHGSKLEKRRTGPWESVVLDSAVSVSSGAESKIWVLEFIDVGGEMRRDIWHAYISEVISLHKFIHEYGPEEGDPLVSHVYGAQKGNARAITNAVSSIVRLQSLQFVGKLLDDPCNLVQFSYLQNSPYGNVVYQTLALSCWGGPLVSKSMNAVKATRHGYQEVGSQESFAHVYDLEGSVYLKQWMRSPSWASRDSLSFWRNISTRGVVLSKHLVVADSSLIEKAARICRYRCQVVEVTQATIDSAKLEGIPSNIDLFKELLLPITIASQNFDNLRRWEKPVLTLSFLGLAYTIILRNLLPFVLPTTFILVAVFMLSLKVLKERGLLRRSLETVTLHDQPTSNTIQQIIAIKKAMRDTENFLQNLNVSLLKIRTIILSGQPQITTEVALVLLSAGIILLTIPLKYVLAFILFDLFTRELEFRREMAARFMKFLKERWDAVHAAPLIILPFESDETSSTDSKKETDKNKALERTQSKHKFS